MRTRQPIRGKRPRNTGYSSQSINARSLSARITEQKKGREKRQKQKEEKTRKRATEKNSTFQYTFRARYCTETSRSCSFRFGKTRKQISLRAVYGGSICKKTCIFAVLFVKTARSIFSRYWVWKMHLRIRSMTTRRKNRSTDATGQLLTLRRTDDLEFRWRIRVHIQ